MTIRRFILKSLAAALPVWIVLAIYLVSDPFNVLRPKTSRAVPHQAAGRNMGVVSITTYLEHNDSARYDSFIFGSSMSQNYRADQWRQYLPAGASVLHFDATMETVDGIVDKIRYLNDHGTNVDNALIIIEEEMLRRQPLDNDILHVRPPEITSEVSRWHFHTLYFNAYKNPLVMGWCLAPKYFAKQMEDEGLITTDPAVRYEAANEYRYNSFDSLIDRDPDAFFTTARINAIKASSDWKPEMQSELMTPHLIAKLKELKALLEQNHTNYMVIIQPRYHRRWISHADMALLVDILGKERVHDYSRDSVLCNDPRAYYDRQAHLTSRHCNALLDRAYGPQPPRR